MVKKICLLSYCFLFFFFSKAQENSVSAGSELSGSGGKVSQTIGQVIYTTNSSATNILSQGMQQTYITIEETTLNEQNKFASLKVYPNPSYEYVILEVGDLNYDNVDYTLNDINGKILLEQIRLNTKNSIDLKHFNNGTYFLNLIINNNIVKSFKLIKTQ